MKPSELFPGAVTAQGVVADALCDSVVLTDGRTELYDSVAPLPISPAVLRGLGIPGYELMNGANVKSAWRIDNDVIQFAHQVQMFYLLLNGVELTWNQDEYEKALKEEAK